jgi:hypothetical protein
MLIAGGALLVAMLRRRHIAHLDLDLHAAAAAA